MRSGICPKCGEKEVRVSDQGSSSLRISLGAFDSVSLTYYICSKCGYVESYISEHEMLPLIAMRLPKSE